MPGPTKISDATYADIKAATESRILEISHRSAEFTDLSKAAVDGVRQFLNVPAEYHVVFTTSASENWELMATNLVESSVHCITNGNFSNIGHNFHAWGKDVSETVVEWGKHVDVKMLNIPHRAELITLAYNETSTGVTYLNDEIKHIRNTHPEKLLAVDITSNSGVQKMHISDADVWYFSVQKGLGLPSGLGVCILSPRAHEKAVKVVDSKIHHSAVNFKSMVAQMAGGKYQTISTPNIMNIYLLAQKMARWNARISMDDAEKRFTDRASRVYEFFENLTGFSFTAQAEDAAHRSVSCLCFSGAEADVAEVHRRSEGAGIAIGKGYGKFKKTGFRIANYDALSDADFEKLLSLFK